MTDDDMIERFRMYSERFKQASLAGEFYLDTLQHNIIRLRKERDEARREILESLHPDSRKSYADARGWDCLKEATDER